jgi:hypothetical protein
MLFLIRILTAYQFKKLVPILLLCSVFSVTTSYSQCLSITKSARNITAKAKQGAIQIKDAHNLDQADDKFASAQAVVSLSLLGNTPIEELELKDFDFSVPEQSIICGVVVRVKRKSSSALSVTIGEAGPKDDKVMLIKNGSTDGVNTAQNNFWDASDTYSSYGASNATWGMELRPFHINSPDFGVSMAMNFKATLVNVGVLMKAEIDHVEMTVYYQSVIVLPIQLNEFKASQNNNKVQLNWVLSNQELGTLVYVQRSEDATTWTTLEQVPVLSNSLVSQQYNSTDLPRTSGSYRYRLKIVSPDGSVHYSKEVPVKWRNLNQNAFYTLKGKQLIIHRISENSSIDLFNRNGVPVYSSVNIAAQNTVIEVGHLPAGIYLLKVGDQVHKILKQ